MIYSLSEGNIERADWIGQNVTLDEAMDWIDLNAFESWRMKQEMEKHGNH